MLDFTGPASFDFTAFDGIIQSAVATATITVAQGATGLTINSVIGNETITGPAWVALPVILAGLGIVGYAQSARAQRRGGQRRAAAHSPLPRR